MSSEDVVLGVTNQSAPKRQKIFGLTQYLRKAAGESPLYIDPLKDSPAIGLVRRSDAKE